MPRQIDLFSQNLQVTNDPNNQISVTSAQINHLNDQIPAALAAAEKIFLDNVLQAIDQATGLDLVDWLAEAQNLFNSISASLQSSWLNLQNFLNGLAQQTDADVTAALAWLQQQFNQIQAWLQQSWLNFQSFLNGIIQETDADIAAVSAYLNNAGVQASAAFTQIEDFITTGDWSDLTAAWNDLVQGIYGGSGSLGLVGSIPAPAVVNVTQNLQPVWDFPDVQSVQAGGGWSWDGTVDHTGVAGSGSAKYVCNGTLGGLRGIPGAVQPAQVVTPAAWVMWSGVTAAGGTSPFQLELIPYSGSGSSLFAGTPVTVASVTSPGSSHAWEELTGTYTVPSSGVTAVQLRLVVTADATAGTVNWDDCTSDVSGGFLADMQSDTSNIIDSFAPGGTSGQFVTGVENLLALVGLTPASVGGATNLTTLWTYIVTNFINPLNALEISAINGLATSLSALLGTTTFQTLLDSVAAALGHSGTGHTITNIETYLGLIPPANVTNVLGGANLGADVTSVHTTASNGTAWATRLTNDLLVLSDVFHLTYATGTPTDPPGTLSGGKPTWYSCWNDLLALTGVVNSTTAPTDAAPAVATAIAAASTATIGGVTDTVQNHIQAITDGINQGVNGGVATGASTASVATNLASQPQENILPSLSGATSVSVDAAGAGGSATNATSATASHTVAASANLLVATVYISGSPGTVTATCGTEPMALLAGAINFGGVGNLYVFKLSNPPSGSHTVTVTAASTSAVIIVETTSFIGAGNINAGPSGSGTGTDSATISGISSTQLVFNFMAAANTSSTSPAISSYNQTLLKNSGAISSGTSEAALLTGYETGASTSTTFSSTIGGGNSIANLAIVISPVATGAVGSGLRQASTSATSQTGSTGTSTAYAFPTSFFNGSQTITPDLTYAGGTNTCTVSVAGWYMVEVRSLMTFTASLAMVTISPCLFQNGTLEAVGTGLGAAFNVVGAQDCTSAFGGSFIVYCNVGDTLAPGYWMDGTGTVSALSLYGESTGTRTYFGVSLINKSLL